MWVTPSISSKCPILRSKPGASGSSATNAGSQTATAAVVTVALAISEAAIDITKDVANEKVTNQGSVPAASWTYSSNSEAES